MCVCVCVCVSVPPLLMLCLSLSLKKEINIKIFFSISCLLVITVNTRVAPEFLCHQLCPLQLCGHEEISLHCLSLGLFTGDREAKQHQATNVAVVRRDEMANRRSGDREPPRPTCNFP